MLRRNNGRNSSNSSQARSPIFPRNNYRQIDTTAFDFENSAVYFREVVMDRSEDNCTSAVQFRLLFRGFFFIFIFFFFFFFFFSSFFFFNRLCNPCGFWPAQLSLSILSRKVFTECRCQRHVKPPTWRISD